MKLILRVAISQNYSQRAKEARRLLITRPIGPMPLLQRIAFSNRDAAQGGEAFRLLRNQVGHQQSLEHDREAEDI